MRYLLFILILLKTINLYCQENIFLPYSQLYGLKAGGAFYIGTNYGMAGAIGGIFFESVISKIIGPLSWGFQIEANSLNIPINNYIIPFSTNIITGVGNRQYAEIGGGLKLYLFWFSFFQGINYNHFYTGYIIQTNGSTYTTINPALEGDFITLDFGVEITSQITKDLFTKVGAKFIWCFDENFSYSRSILAFIALGFTI